MHLRLEPLSSRLTLSCQAPSSPSPRPGLQLSSQLGARPAWPVPKGHCFPAAPPPRASRRGAERPHPSPLAGRAASRAQARPPPLRPSPQAAQLPLQHLPSRGGRWRGPGRRAQTCSGCLPRRSPLRLVAVVAEAAGVPGSRSSSGVEQEASAPLPRLLYPNLLLARCYAAARDSPLDMDFLLALVIGSSLYLQAAAEFDGR